jgi:hypothetical protein
VGVVLNEIFDRINQLLDLSQRWLKIDEACRYAKLSRPILMELIGTGEIRARLRPKGGWIVDRLSIDEYNAGHEEGLYLDIAKRCGL